MSAKELRWIKSRIYCHWRLNYPPGNDWYCLHFRRLNIPSQFVFSVLLSCSHKTLMRFICAGLQSQTFAILPWMKTDDPMTVIEKFRFISGRSGNWIIRSILIDTLYHKIYYRILIYRSICIQSSSDGLLSIVGLLLPILNKLMN